MLMQAPPPPTHPPTHTHHPQQVAACHLCTHAHPLLCACPPACLRSHRHTHRYFYSGALQDGECIARMPPAPFYAADLLKPYVVFDVSRGRGLLQGRSHSNLQVPVAGAGAGDVHGAGLGRRVVGHVA
jgi:hypothetical protein